MRAVRAQPGKPRRETRSFRTGRPRASLAARPQSEDGNLKRSRVIIEDAPASTRAALR